MNDELRNLGKRVDGLFDEIIKLKDNVFSNRELIKNMIAKGTGFIDATNLFMKLLVIVGGLFIGLGSYTYLNNINQIHNEMNQLRQENHDISTKIDNFIKIAQIRNDKMLVSK